MWTLGRKPSQAHRDETARVKSLVHEALGRNPDVALSITEILCADPGCPGTETVILVMIPGRKTAACKVAKVMAEIDDDDVRDALKQLTYTP